MFADEDKEPMPSLQWKLRHIARGEFCKFISQYFDTRLQLMIQTQELMQVTAWEPRKQVVQPQLGTPLSTILRNYDLSPRMKVTLAYIIVRSVLRFYGSDWMNTKWTSETIHFMNEAASDVVGQVTAARIFASKPYFAAGFGEADPDFVESSVVDGAIHRYPRVLALGIMLVEIGMGFPIRQPEDGLDRQSLTAKLNGDWSSAMRYTKSEEAGIRSSSPSIGLRPKGACDRTYLPQPPWSGDRSKRGRRCWRVDGGFFTRRLSLP